MAEGKTKRFMRCSTGRNGEDEDDYLMRAASYGDRSAFDLLLDRHRSWVEHLIFAICQDETQSEDLTQEVFYRVYRHLNDYVPGGQFVPWLKRIAVNLARNALRDQKIRQECQLTLNENAEHSHFEDSTRFDPASILASRLLNEEIRTALEQLKPEYRDVLLRHYMIGESIPEIAHQMECPEGTVKSRLFHARQKLRAYSEGSLLEARRNPKTLNTNTTEGK